MAKKYITNKTDDNIDFKCRRERIKMEKKKRIIHPNNSSVKINHNSCKLKDKLLLCISRLKTLYMDKMKLDSKIISYGANKESNEGTLSIKYFSKVIPTPNKFHIDTEFIRRHLNYMIYQNRIDLNLLTEIYNDLHFDNLSLKSLKLYVKSLGLKISNSQKSLVNKCNVKNIFQRIAFIDKFIEVNTNDEIIISIGEIGITNRKRCIINTFNKNILKKSKVKFNSKKLFIIMAITKDKILHFSFIDRNLDIFIFERFLLDTIGKIISDDNLRLRYYEEKVYILLANSGIHKSNHIINFIMQTKLRVIFISQYFKSYNHIEYVLNIIENHHSNICKNSVGKCEEIISESIINLLNSETVLDCFSKSIKDMINDLNNLMVME